MLKRRSTLPRPPTAPLPVAIAAPPITDRVTDLFPSTPAPIRFDDPGNLSWGVTNDSLADVFHEYGASDVTVVTDMNTGRSRGFGFVTVPDQAVADQCIAALDGADVDGRAIRVNVSVAREDRPPRSDRPPRDGPRRGYDFDGRKVYFGNLSWGMDHLDLQDLCGEFGTVEDARLITDRETNRSRGFGFVTMSTVAEAEEVVNQLNGQDVDGRVLRVNIANVDK